MEKITLDGSALNLEDIAEIAKGYRVLELQKSVDFFSGEDEKELKEGAYVGLNLTKADSRRLQKNVLRSYASFFDGDYISEQQGRASMLLRVNSMLSVGGLSFSTSEAVLRFLNLGAAPVVTLKSVGKKSALAQMFLPLIGEGRVYFEGKIVETEYFLNRSDFKSVELMPGEAEMLVEVGDVERGILALDVLRLDNLLNHLESLLAMNLEVLRLIPPGSIADLLVRSGITSRLRKKGDVGFVQDGIAAGESLRNSMKYLRDNFWEDDFEVCMLKSAICRFADASAKRIERLLTVDSLDLPAGLIRDEASVGVKSFLDIAESLLREISCMDVWRKVDLLEKIIAMEFICLSQAMDLIRPLRSVESIERMHSGIRHYIRTLKEDRDLSADLERMQGLVATGKLLDRE